MKNFFARLILFLCVGVLINFIVILLYKKVISNNYLSKLDKEYSISTESNKYIKHLIVGDSHSFGLRANMFENALNYGAYNIDYLLLYYKLRRIIEDDNISVSTVVMNCDLGDFSRARIGNSNLYYWNKLVNYLHFLQITGDWKTLFDLIIKGLIFPYSGNLMDVWEYINLDSKKPEKEFGVLATADNSDWRMAKVDTVRNVYTECINLQFYPLAFEYFTLIIKMLERKNVGLILLRFPVSQHFYYENSRCFNPTDYYKQIENIIETIGYRQVKLIDYHDMFFNSNEFFIDPHHLTSEGRALLTDRFLGDLQSIEFID